MRDANHARINRYEGQESRYAETFLPLKKNNVGHRTEPEREKKACSKGHTQDPAMIKAMKKSVCRSGKRLPEKRFEILTLSI